MKKNIFTMLALVAAMIMAVPAQAQLKFGIKAGANINKVTLSNSDWKDNFSKDNQAGFFVGATMDVKIPLLGFGADVSVLYDYKQSYMYEAGDVLAAEPEATKQKYHYMDIPVNIKHTFSLGKVISLYLATGPQFSFNFTKKTEATVLVESENKKCEVYWNAGGGFTILNHYRLGYAYNIPLNSSATTTIKDLTGAEFSSCSYKNNTHQISFTYIF